MGIKEILKELGMKVEADDNEIYYLRTESGHDVMRAGSIETIYDEIKRLIRSNAAGEAAILEEFGYGPDELVRRADCDLQELLYAPK